MTNEEAKKILDSSLVWPKMVDEECEALGMAINALKQQKTSKWIGIEYEGYADGNPVYDVYECSSCGYVHNGESDTLSDYCPDCGAKMEMDREGNWDDYEEEDDEDDEEDCEGE